MIMTTDFYTIMTIALLAIVMILLSALQKEGQDNTLSWRFLKVIFGEKKMLFA